MKKLYPLKFNPVFKEKVWGGNKIHDSFQYKGVPARCGEAWLLSGVAGSETHVTNGFLAGNTINELVTVYMADLVGEEVFNRYGDEFPVLIKIIDANQWLSVQVHPDDALAMERHGMSGKTEMWYIIDAEPDAALISGLATGIDRNGFLLATETGNINKVLHYEKAEPGDIFYTPAGQVHAIGPGILLAEIQQTSDITYRIYDWDRKDKQGNSRELHLNEALDAIDYTPVDKVKTEYKPGKNKTVPLVNSEYFNTSFIWLTHGLKKDYGMLDAFVILLAVEGEGWIESTGERYSLKKGEAILLPATIAETSIFAIGTLKLLEVTV